MTSPVGNEFDEAFIAMCGNPPFRWQRRLAAQMALANVPSRVTLPTGLGKTSVIPIWLIALVSGASLPRRLVYIVNRRTVVDQATDDAIRILHRIEYPAQAGEFETVLCRLRDSLCRISGDTSSVPLAVSTLRGELADNEEWKRNPARPAIIVGTIDMIGSKLLFSGYGDGRYGRAHHAGLIGQDTLIVHDESHLSPAFDKLLCSIDAEQQRSGDSRRIRVMRLSATARVTTSNNQEVGAEFGIEDEDRSDAIVQQRVNAKKQLRFVPAASLPETIADEAVKHEPELCRVLVYVRSPKDASQVVEAVRDRLGLKKAKDEHVADRIRLLTGTIRGLERDKLVESDLFKAFQSGADRSNPLANTKYLVSTSAGEVGADWDADHLVCDLAPLDSMTQRFGRVNRLGGKDQAGKERAADIAVFVEKNEKAEKDEKANKLAAAIAKTGEIFRRVADADGDGDVSPGAIGSMFKALSPDEQRDAFSPEPEILPATDILFDQWSLTSIAGKLPGRPEVGPYLHGVPDWEPPETHIAWRADIAKLAASGGLDDDGKEVPASQDDLERVFEVFPLRSIEKLRERSDRVLEQLQKIAERMPDTRCVVMKGGETRWTTISELAPEKFDKKRIASSPLAYATIVLPVEVGGLTEAGTLEGSEPPRENPSELDVAEHPIGGIVDRQRVLVGGDAEGESPAANALLGGELLAKSNVVSRHEVRIGGTPASEDSESSPRFIEYRVLKGEDREPGTRVLLDKHNAATGDCASRIAGAAGVSKEIGAALTIAAMHHDTGKNREIWQRYASNPPPRPVTKAWNESRIAKSDKYGHWKQLKGYRHEFGSLLDVSREIAEHAERDLILHLIAAHHGWGRPHFEPKHFDQSTATAINQKIAIEATQRFARLQQRFGRWGLAWLESLVRCADVEASTQMPADESARRLPKSSGGAS